MASDPSGCPTCSYTMQKLWGAAVWHCWHCPRCGTIRQEFPSPTDTAIEVCRPQLVDNCRGLLKGNIKAASAFVAWLSRLGILESIWRPEERPT